MKLVLLGPPGAGKGTQAVLIKERFHVLHISTGDILREEMKNKTPLGEEARKYVEGGGLVPDEVVTKIIENKLKNDKQAARGYMLDGFPRTKIQAQDLDRILAGLKDSLDYALYFEVSLPVVLSRLTGRRVCKQCGALYHVVNKPSKKDGICDSCGGNLYQRPDDNEETIKKRIDVYLKSTTPIIDYYQAQGKLRKVNADRDAAHVMQYLMDIFAKDGKIDKDKITERS